MQNLLATVPFLGRFTDDVVQGVGAGLMTSVSGHAALMRCRAFHGWNEKEAQALLRKQLGQYLVDIKSIVFDDVLSELRMPVIALNPDIAKEPGWLSGLRDKISTAIDDTTDGMDYYIKRPAVAAGRGFARKGSDLTECTLGGIRAGGTSTLAGFIGLAKTVSGLALFGLDERQVILPKWVSNWRVTFLKITEKKYKITRALMTTRQQSPTMNSVRTIPGLSRLEMFMDIGGGYAAPDSHS